MSSSLENQAARTWTLKIELDGDLRRLRGWPKDGAEPTIQGLREAASSLFALSPSQAEAICIKFKDEKGELSVLSEKTLPNLVGQSGVLYLIANVVVPTTSESSESVPALVAASDDPVPSSMPELAAALLRQQLPDDVSPAHDQQQPPLPPPAQGPSEAPCAAGPQETMTDASPHDTLKQRLALAKPRLAEGVQNFTKQVTSDFQSARADMMGAFGTTPPESDDHITLGHEVDASVNASRDLRQVAQVGKAVASGLAGVAVAARLIPVRATRLAADSVAAVAGVEPMTGQAESGAAAAEDAVSPDAREILGASSGAEDFMHFKEQVKKDYHTAHEELKTAFGYCSQPNCVVPDIAGKIAGVTVATSLVPIHAARLAVAGVARLASNAEEPQAPEVATETPPTVESFLAPEAQAHADVTAPVEPSQHDEEDTPFGNHSEEQEFWLESDEALARRLQAEEDAVARST